MPSRRSAAAATRTFTPGPAQSKTLDLYLSALTLGEIRKGIEGLRERDPVQAEVFAGWLRELHSRFTGRSLPIDAQASEEWGRLNAVRTRSTVASLIAATARIHELTIVTRNTSDFDGCDVPVLNLWQHQHR